MSTITQKQQSAIIATLAKMDNLPSGVGTTENACSIAAINLALTGKLTDVVPNCMSLVIGKWIIRIQDAMPAGVRNSARWRALLPLAAGTGRGAEDKLAGYVTNWMWKVLEKLQPAADKGGFGEKWREMIAAKTADAAKAATNAAAANAAYAYAATANAAYAYANAAKAAAKAAAYAYAAAAAANAAYAYANAAKAADFWESIDPCGCLERMISISKETT
jgi:hypothetical protein